MLTVDGAAVIDHSMAVFAVRPMVGATFDEPSSTRELGGHRFAL